MSSGLVIKCPQRHLAEVPVPPEMLTFSRLLHQGHTIIRHFALGPPELAQIFVRNDALEMRQITQGLLASLTKSKTKNTSVLVRELRFVVWGKQAHHAFAKAKFVPDDFCFSLVTDTHTFDFECASKEERDALAKGFAYEISKYRRLN